MPAIIQPIEVDGLVDMSQEYAKEYADLARKIKAVGYIETPFLNAISEATPVSRAANTVHFGHKWSYDIEPTADLNNAYVEGSSPAPAKHFEGAEANNHYQIFKSTYGVTGSAKSATRIDGQSILTKEGENALKKIYLDMEYTLLSAQAAVQRVKEDAATSTPAVAGRLGGIKSFAHVNNTLYGTSDGTSAGTAERLSHARLRELFKLGFKNGIIYDKIIVNDKQKDAIDELMWDKGFNQKISDPKISNNVTNIMNFYVKNATIMYSPFVADDEILALRIGDFFKVNWRVLQRGIDIPTGDDVLTKQLIAEFTLRVSTAMSFSWLRGLEVA
jgi:hypothetical protein